MKKIYIYNKHKRTKKTKKNQVKETSRKSVLSETERHFVIIKG